MFYFEKCINDLYLSVENDIKEIVDDLFKKIYDFTKLSFRYIEDKEFAINVISKSGTTTETSIAFRIFKEICEKRYGIEKAREIGTYIMNNASNKILDSIDKAISKRWNSEYDKERAELFKIRGDICKIIEESQRKNK